jgi:tetratricopeptide (TPR) repeat protein
MKRVKRFGELAAHTQPPADLAELRRRGFHALRSLLGRLTKVRPVVLFVDDAHWGDADSGAFFNELIHLGEPAVLTILAHRPEDYFGVVAKLKQPQLGVRRGDVRDIEVRALDDGDAFTLVGQLAHDTARIDHVVRAGAGNPLVLSELARAPQLAPNAKVDDLVRSRVARLSPEAQAMLAVSSIAAKPIPIDIAAHAAGIVEGHDAAGQLSIERLATLRRVNGQMILQPAHDHVRVAVLGSLDIESKAGWNEALARAYEDVQGEANLDTQAVVEHWLAAGHPGNAAHHAVSAAARAEEALAFRRAAELYEIALSYGPWDAAGRRDLLRAKAHALACAGQLDEAATIYGHAAQILPDEESLECERLRIEALLRRGRLDDALPAAEALLKQIGVRSPFGASRTKLATQWMQQKLRGLDYVEREPSSITRAELLRVDVLYSIVSGLAFADPQLGRVLQSELMRAAIECGEPVRMCLALAQEVCYAAGSGSRNANAVAAVGARLRGLAAKVDHPHITGLTDTAIGIGAYMSGQYREARTHLETGLRVLRNHGAGVRWELDVAETYWLSTLYYLGEWRELIRNSQLFLRDAIERGDVVAQLGAQTGRCNLAWLIAGRPEEARAQLEAAHKHLPAGFHLPHVLWVQAACNCDLYVGNVKDAAKRLNDTWSEIDRIGALRSQSLRVELLLLRGRISLAQGKLEAARIADDLIKEGATWANGIGHLLHAAVERDRDSSIISLLAAEEDFVTSGMAGWLHVARLRRGQLEAGPGGAARAEAARDLLKDLGAAFPDRIASLLVPWPA